MKLHKLIWFFMLFVQLLFSMEENKQKLWETLAIETKLNILKRIADIDTIKKIAATHKEALPLMRTLLDYGLQWKALPQKTKARNIKAHASTITSLAISSDNTFFVTSSDDRTAKIWDVVTGQLLYTLIGHLAEIRSAEISSNNSLVATCSDDQTARIWDIQTGQLLHVLDGDRKKCRFA